MKHILKFSSLLFLTIISFSACEFIKSGKEAFLGTFSSDIDYSNSIVRLAVDLDFDGDQNMTTNPPGSPDTIAYNEKVEFINAYFSESMATIKDIGGDSVKYTDSKRTMYGCIKGDSIIFKESDLGATPSADGIVVDSTVLNVKGIVVSNDVYLDYVFSGTGSVVLSPTITRYGIVEGTVKMVLRK